LVTDDIDSQHNPPGYTPGNDQTPQVRRETTARKATRP
jgi:hypothetical protein